MANLEHHLCTLMAVAASCRNRNSAAMQSLSALLAWPSEHSDIQHTQIGCMSARFRRGLCSVSRWILPVRWMAGPGPL